MLVRKFSLIIAAAGLAFASTANAAVPSRVGAPVMNANYQSDDDDGDSTAIIVGVVLLGLIVTAALVGGGKGDNPFSP